MKDTANLSVGLVICLALVGYFGYLIFTSLQSPATTSTVQPAAISLDEKALVQMRAKSLNGNLPLTLDQNNLGKTEPFTR